MKMFRRSQIRSFGISESKSADIPEITRLNPARPMDRNKVSSKPIIATAFNKEKQIKLAMRPRTGTFQESFLPKVIPKWFLTNMC